MVLTDLIRTLSHFEQKQGGSDLRLQPPLFCMKFSGAAGDWGWLRPLRPVSAGETASPRFPPPVVNQKSQIVPNIVKFWHPQTSTNRREMSWKFLNYIGTKHLVAERCAAAVIGRDDPLETHVLWRSAALNIRFGCWGAIWPQRAIYPPPQPHQTRAIWTRRRLLNQYEFQHVFIGWKKRQAVSLGSAQKRWHRRKQYFLLLYFPAVLCCCSFFFTFLFPFSHLSFPIFLFLSIPSASLKFSPVVVLIL